MQLIRRLVFLAVALATLHVAGVVEVRGPDAARRLLDAATQVMAGWTTQQLQRLEAWVLTQAQRLTPEIPQRETGLPPRGSGGN